MTVILVKTISVLSLSNSSKMNSNHVIYSHILIIGIDKLPVITPLLFCHIPYTTLVAQENPIEAYD